METLRIVHGCYERRHRHVHAFPAPHTCDKFANDIAGMTSIAVREDFFGLVRSGSWCDGCDGFPLVLVLCISSESPVEMVVGVVADSACLINLLNTPRLSDSKKDLCFI